MYFFLLSKPKIQYHKQLNRTGRAGDEARQNAVRVSAPVAPLAAGDCLEVPPRWFLKAKNGQEGPHQCISTEQQRKIQHG